MKFINLSSQFANHAHSDLVEFFGEFGLVGITLIILSFIKFFLSKKSYTLINIIVFSYAIIILSFDFSSTYSYYTNFIFVFFIVK